MSNRRGVDVASWQGLPGQWAAAAGKISWAAVKITELQPDGTRYVNPDAAADWQYLKDHGIARVAYLYPHPAADPVATVDFFAQAMEKLGLDDEDMVMLDFEVSDNLPPADVAKWGVTVMADLQKRFSRVPLLYTYPAFAYEGNCAGLGRYPLNISDPNNPAGHPVVPPPWKTWAVHQFWTSAPIDRDLIAYSDTAEMMEVLAKAGAAHRKPKKHRVRKTVTKVHRTVRKEPVVTSGSLLAALSAVVTFLFPHMGVHLHGQQLDWVLTGLIAAAGLAIAVFARPVRTGLLSAAASAWATGFSTVHLHVHAATLGGWLPVVSLLGSGLVRELVSPKPAPVESPPAT